MVADNGMGRGWAGAAARRTVAPVPPLCSILCWRSLSTAGPLDDVGAVVAVVGVGVNVMNDVHGATRSSTPLNLFLFRRRLFYCRWKRTLETNLQCEWHLAATLHRFSKNGRTGSASPRVINRRNRRPRGHPGLAKFLSPFFGALVRASCYRESETLVSRRPSCNNAGYRDSTALCCGNLRCRWKA